MNRYQVECGGGLGYLYGSFDDPDEALVHADENTPPGAAAVVRDTVTGEYLGPFSREHADEARARLEARR